MLFFHIKYINFQTLGYACRFSKNSIEIVNKTVSTLTEVNCFDEIWYSLVFIILYMKLN